MIEECATLGRGLKMSKELDFAHDLVAAFWKAQGFSNNEAIAKYYSVASSKPEDLREDYITIREILDKAIEECKR